MQPGGGLIDQLVRSGAIKVHERPDYDDNITRIKGREMPQPSWESAQLMSRLLSCILFAARCAHWLLRSGSERTTEDR